MTKVPHRHQLLQLSALYKTVHPDAHEFEARHIIDTALRRGAYYEDLLHILASGFVLKNNSDELVNKANRRKEMRTF